MVFGRRSGTFWSMATAIVGLIGVVSVRLSAQQQPLMTENVFRDI